MWESMQSREHSRGFESSSGLFLRFVQHGAYGDLYNCVAFEAFPTCDLSDDQNHLRHFDMGQ